MNKPPAENPFASPQASGTSAAAGAAIPAQKPGKTELSLQGRLWAMMFLQYFVQGCYLPIVSVYFQDKLGFDGAQLGYFSSALAIGPLFAPWVVGQLVDRHFATERVLAFCHLAAGVLMLLIYRQTAFWPVMILGTLYSILYIPSMMLTNSLAFAHLKDRGHEFPLVRMFGTLGFILPAWLIELYWLQGLKGDELNSARGIAFWLSGAAGLAMAVYSLTLPHTPPSSDRSGRFAPGAVVGLLRQRDFLALVLVTIVIAIVHQYYFTWNSPYLKFMLRSGGIEGALEQRISSIGQIAEIAVMLALGLGLALVRFGFKRIMLAGATAYLLRSLILAAAAGWEGPFAARMTLVGFGQALHGVCFGCFLAVAFIYVDRRAPADLRGSAQTLYGTCIFGLGCFLGGMIAGQIGEAFTVGSGPQAVHNWVGIWLSSSALALIAVLGFALFFPATSAVKDAPAG